MGQEIVCMGGPDTVLIPRYNPARARIAAVTSTLLLRTAISGLAAKYYNLGHDSLISDRPSGVLQGAKGLIIRTLSPRILLYVQYFASV